MLQRRWHDSTEFLNTRATWSVRRTRGNTTVTDDSKGNAVLRGPTQQLAWRVLTTVMAVWLAGSSFGSAAELDLGLEDLLMPAQLLQEDLAPVVPAPEAEADTLPSAQSPMTFDTDAPSLFGPELTADEVVTDHLSAGAVDVPAPVYSSGSWFRSGRWYAAADFVMMRPRRLSRGTVTNTTAYLFSSNGVGFKKGILAYDTFASTAISRVSRNVYVDSLAPQFKPGTRLTLGRFLGRDAANRDHAVEVTYLGLFDWTSRLSFAGVGASFNTPPASIRTVLGGVVLDTIGNPTAIFVPGFSDADAQRFEYGSDLNSLELNFRIHGRPDRDVVALQPNGAWIRHDTSGRLFSLLGGIRYMSINDMFRLESESAQILDNDGEEVVPEISGRYRVGTHNDMVGVQFGIDATEKYSEWNWGVRGRIGAFANFVERDSRIDTVNGITPRSQVIKDESLVSMVESGVFAGYQVRPNAAFRGAFDVMYLPSGTADAERNISLEPNFPTFNTTGRRMYYGVSIGYEMVW